MKRYVVEGTWTGYVAHQCRVVHREVVGEKRAERLMRLDSIRYTDGTSLLISVRPAEPFERVRQELSYCDLIAEAERSGKSRYVVVPK